MIRERDRSQRYLSAVVFHSSPPWKRKVVGEIRLGNHPSRSHLGARASGPQCIGCVWKAPRWRRARGSMGWPAVYRLRLEDTALASSTREYGPARSV